MTVHITASPLTWPEGWKRTPKHQQQRSQFKTKKQDGWGFRDISLSRAVNFVLDELSRMGVRKSDIIISTDLRLRSTDGLPISKQRIPDDVGAAVWWIADEVQQVIALDTYDRIEDNIYAIGKTIEAMRGIDRWGKGEILKRTFAGFTALPGPDHIIGRNWRDVLGYYGDDLQEANKAYMRARGVAHPDHGGTDEAYYEVNQAWAQAEQELSE